MIKQMRPLKASSLIDLVVPASPVTLEQMELAVQKVESLGFKARVPCSADLPFLLRKAKPPSSASVVFRHLRRAFLASDSSALWCVRGGYGSQKLMPFLSKMKKPAKPKLFIGYSDVTVIQIFLNLKWKWQALHFPVLTHLDGARASDLKKCQNLLTGAQKEQHFFRLRLLNRQYAGESITSSITGGNLSLIQSSIGAPWNCYFKNKILFLEDTGEAPYRIDRALQQLLYAGVFKGIKALAVGDFTFPGIKSQKAKTETKKLFQSLAQGLPFPVVEGIPCGHGLRKAPIPFLTPSVLSFHSGGRADLRIAGPFKSG